ncbi:hypothetical protein BKA61DRAFT_573737 [Leptodontidium sp. MPI-SDFR-AT-0119]|nr:hypothetical protein BKA61DRAFT_573737 [Leptodontidium sp. MPI-SDFR-AT-0119]
MQPTLLALPLEIRHKIFRELSEAKHTILIAPRVPAHGPLRNLQLTCKQINTEVKFWSTIYPNLVDTHFSLLDFSLTIFKIGFSNKKASLKGFQSSIMPYPGLRNRRKAAQRVFRPNCSSRDLMRLAVWKLAMDIAGTNDWNRVGDVIYSATKYMERLADLPTTPELSQIGRETAQRFCSSSILSVEQAYDNFITGTYDMTVLDQDEALVFQSFSARVKDRFWRLAVLPHWDIFSCISNFWRGFLHSKDCAAIGEKYWGVAAVDQGDLRH